jgi:hypothetical protein
MELELEVMVTDLEDLRKQVGKGPSSTEAEASKSVASLKPLEAQMVVVRLMDKAVSAADKGHQLREEANRARCEREALLVEKEEVERRCVPACMGGGVTLVLPLQRHNNPQEARLFAPCMAL